MKLRLKATFAKKIEKNNKKYVFGLFNFLFFVSFGDKVMTIQKYHVIFVYILQGKTGKMEI